jgi:hypothetical protein
VDHQTEGREKDQKLSHSDLSNSKKFKRVAEWNCQSGLRSSKGFIIRRVGIISKRFFSSKEREGETRIKDKPARILRKSKKKRRKGLYSGMMMGVTPQS